MKQNAFKPLLKRLEKHRKLVGDQRDELVKLKDEIESLLDPVERGIEALDDAIQAFSEQA